MSDGRTRTGFPHSSLILITRECFEQVLDLVLQDPAVQHGPSEFVDLGKKPEEISFPQKGSASMRPNRSTFNIPECCKHGRDPEVLSATKSTPEEIARQL